MTEPCSKETEITHLVKQVDEIHTMFFGSNGKGFKEKIAGIVVQLKFQWAVLGLIFLWLIVKQLVL